MSCQCTAMKEFQERYGQMNRFKESVVFTWMCWGKCERGGQWCNMGRGIVAESGQEKLEAVIRDIVAGYTWTEELTNVSDLNFTPCIAKFHAQNITDTRRTNEEQVTKVKQLECSYNNKML